MKYSNWVTIITAINAGIVFTISWSVMSLSNLIFSLQGFPVEDIGGQPLMVVACLVLSTINTPLIAVPLAKYPEKFKATMLYCVILPLIAMVLMGGVAITIAITNSLELALVLG